MVINHLLNGMILQVWLELLLLPFILSGLFLVWSPMFQRFAPKKKKTTPYQLLETLDVFGSSSDDMWGRSHLNKFSIETMIILIVLILA